MRFLISLLCLSACVSASAPNNKTIYPVETAREDGDWTLLYRDVPFDISTDGYVVFIIPTNWTPEGLTDNNWLEITTKRTQDTSIITMKRFNPTPPFNWQNK